MSENLLGLKPTHSSSLASRIGCGSIICTQRCLLRPISVPKILDVGGFDSSSILNLGDEILMSIGNSPESLSQRILVGILLEGRLGIRVD